MRNNPKKPRKGAKKKKDNTQEKKPRNKEHYRIIITSQNKLIVCVYKSMTKKSAVSAFEKIISENKKTVRFPIRYSSRDHKLMESKYEILLLKNKDKNNDGETLLRNEYGQLVNHVTNSNNMVIYKKNEYLFEESFWVYGYNPKSQRKSFEFISNELLFKNLLKVKYPIKKVLIYKNKLIIKDDYDFEMVICKCENDAARLYTELEKEVNAKKIKSVFFSGFAKDVNKKTIENEIINKTGWSAFKVNRSSTRP